MARSRDPDKRPRKGLSRRAFLSRGAGLAIAAPIVTGTGLPAPQGAAADVKILGPGKVPVTLRVNGKTHSLNVEPRVTLLEALRTHLDYTGAKKVCDRATCGACTVIMGGKEVYACSILAVEAQGKDILTVEGLSASGKLHPIQEAFIEHDATQCGFCTPGFVVACKALLDRNPNPTVADIEKGLGGNLCRCGTYVGIRQAVLSAAKTMKGGRTDA
ncbi:MAG: (2Fe-2S)-binding protein [Acidobacteria bacterium]|nr:(2Fe-2S)-binding protein [Acidobacteriota bacterium]